MVALLSGSVQDRPAVSAASVNELVPGVMSMSRVWVPPVPLSTRTVTPLTTAEVSWNASNGAGWRNSSAR
jgi:hypothetical protein